MNNIDTNTTALAKVLIVDDTATNVSMLFNFLTSHNYEALVALDGESALKVVEYENPDLILLDIMMPGIDGFETCRLIKERSACQDTPVIFMTALSSTESKVKGFEMGAVDYVTKPLQYEEVLARVSAHIKLHQLQRDLQSKTAALQQEVYERKQVEKALEQERASLAERVKERTKELQIMNAELVVAMRMKNEFMTTMSHELRTPLNPILNISEMLIEDLYGELVPEQKKALQTIREHGQQLLSLISDIWDFSKIGGSETQLEEQPISIVALAEASLQKVYTAARSKQLSVSTNIQVEQDLLHGDERRLRQMLDKLVDNAVKFTPEGGKIGLDITGDVDNAILHLCVWDTGIGIAKTDQVRLFEPFVQLDSALSRQYNGAGLGLSLVQKLIDMHGGTVTVESELEQGSRFTLSIPWKGLPLKAAPVPVEDSGQVAHIKVLLAEDSESNMTAMNNYLTACGFTVIQAWNAEELMSALNAQQPDVVVLDVQMPSVNGTNVIQHIRDNPTYRQIPIIALTALSVSNDRELFAAAGASAHLNKPVRLRELSIKISQLASK